MQTQFIHLEKNYPYFLIFAAIKDFVDVYNVDVEYLKIPKYWKFPLILTYAVCSNFWKFRDFLQVKNVLHFGKEAMNSYEILL